MDEDARSHPLWRCVGRALIACTPAPGPRRTSASRRPRPAGPDAVVAARKSARGGLDAGDRVVRLLFRYVPGAALRD